MLKYLICLTVLIHRECLGWNVQTISSKPTLFGDSLHWCEESQSLLYVDFFGINYDLYRYDYKERRIYAAKVVNSPSSAAFILPIEGRHNQFAVGFSDRTVKIIEWNGRSDKAHIKGILFAVEQNSFYNTNVWHDAKTDPMGRFYGGTMRMDLCTHSSPPDGSFYRYTRNGGVRQLFSLVQISNGITWSVPAEKMFFIDACRFAIEAFDWSPATGQISNGRKIFQIYKGLGVPTFTGLGLTIDTKDNLYVGIYNGSAVWRVDPKTSKVLEVYELPTRVITNIAFGGPNLDELFVASSKLPFDLFTGQLSNDTITSTAGSLFIIKGIRAKGFKGQALSIQ